MQKKTKKSETNLQINLKLLRNDFVHSKKRTQTKTNEMKMINIILSLFDSISDRARAKHLTKTNPDKETKK